MAITYAEPELPAGVKVQRLRPDHVPNLVLDSNTEVLVINRGPNALSLKWDGEDHRIPSHRETLIRMPYGAARHFQEKAVVPGSRDAQNLTAQESFLGIIGIDPEEACEPFTEEECARFALIPEAIARDRGEVDYVPMEKARRAMPNAANRGRGGRRGLDASAQATPAAADAAETALDPAEKIDYLQES